MRGLNKMKIDIEKLNEVLEKDELLEDDELIIKNTVDTLNNLIKKEAVETEPVVETTQEKVDTPPEDTTDIQIQIEAELAA
jgi:hypothetical protein